MAMHRDAEGRVIFEDWPDFTPNLTPREIFQSGSFGGSYWRPIRSSVTGGELSEQHLEFEDWWEGIPDSLLTSDVYDKSVNRYGVKSGSSLEMWESKGWIRSEDPYGWVQWYCRFFSGRRGPDDERQVKRWNAFAGERGRFRSQLIKKVIAREARFDDDSVSPVIRQSLQHWGYRLNESDFEEASLRLWEKSF
jgi:hypothetical protein